MPTQEFKLEYTPCHTPVVKLRIRGEDHFFMIDTGATATVLCHKLVSNFKFDIDKFGIMAGVTEGFAAIMRVNLTFNIFGGSLKQVSVSDRMMDIKTSLPFPISGLIGQDLLSQFSEITFNYNKQTIRFTL